MNIIDIYYQFITDISYTTWYEFVAVFAGIISVWYARSENILVYPIGLINTIIYIYISFKGQLLGEAAVNFYYTIMSGTGWYMWTRKNQQKEMILHITFSDKKNWVQQIGFFLFFYISIWGSLSYFKSAFFEGVIPWADAFASATAFTAMWLMTKKKNRKLVLVDSYKYGMYTLILCKTLCFYKHILFGIISNGYFWFN